MRTWEDGPANRRLEVVRLRAIPNAACCVLRFLLLSSSDESVADIRLPPRLSSHSTRELDEGRDEALENRALPSS